VKSTITIDVETDENQVPQRIVWTAEDGGVAEREARAMLLAMWDDSDGIAMRMDLWTKKMTVEEMQHFTCQTLMTLADTFERATSDTGHARALREFTGELARRLGVREG